MSALRAALWSGAVVTFFLSVFLLARNHMTAGSLLFALCIACGGAAEVIATRGRRREKYARRFSSFHELRQAVNEPALRRVREEDGEVAAVRELRRQFPEVPLADAAKLIKDL